MKLSLLAAAAAVGAMALSACTTGDMYGPPYGYADIDYGGYYDGYYGPFIGGYWGPDGYFYYPDRGRYHRDRGHHFRREGGPGYNPIHGHAPPPASPSHGHRGSPGPRP